MLKCIQRVQIRGQVRLYDRKKYLKEKRRDKVDTTTIADCFSISRIYSTNQDVELKGTFEFEALSKPLSFSTTLPKFIESKKKSIILVFTQDPEQAIKLGATIAGGEELFEGIEDGTIVFDTCVSTKAMFPKVIKLARILGPKGLMPSPSRGTVSDDVELLFAKVRGSSQLLSELDSLTTTIGYTSWTNEELESNLLAIHTAILAEKKGKADKKFVERVSLWTNHSPGVILPSKIFK